MGSGVMVVCTAIITKGEEIATKEFTVTVIEKDISFITTWNTEAEGVSNLDQIKLPLSSDGTYDFDVDWGDGKSDTITVYDQAEITHTYTSPGVYDITLIGTIEGFGFSEYYEYEDNRKLQDIKKWG